MYSKIGEQGEQQHIVAIGYLIVMFSFRNQKTTYKILLQYAVFIISSLFMQASYISHEVVFL